MRVFSQYLGLLSLTFLAIQCSTQEENKQQMNKLASSSSPYLLQHAHNPVHWYPWGDEALKEATDSNKLVVVSIGYSACHWCHVMERESFEQEDVGDLMNAHFVSIKVDREERPDVDDVYMNASLLINGSGGWPLNAICLPDGRPVFAGTYFPKEKWMNILLYFAKTWRKEPQKLEDQADHLMQGMNKIEDLPVLDENKDLIAIDQYKQQLQSFSQRMDTVWGGRIGAPKFPMPVIWEWMLMNYYYFENNTALEDTRRTLDKMALGGIYDHVDGGFARYSVDKIWKVPHFEKMLYDNGQLLSLYAKAYKIQPSEDYERVLRKTANFMIEHMAKEDGYFYAAYDADSEGIEGKFYIWSVDELRNILDPTFFETFGEYYSITTSGNWEHGQNILFAEYFPDEFCQRKKLDPKDFKSNLFKSLEKLKHIREGRVWPGLDDKSLTSWNALAIIGLLDTYEALGEEKYLKFAMKAGHFIKDHLQNKNGGLFRNYHRGKASIDAFLDDYALMISACMKLYENSFDESWLSLADQLTQYCLNHFTEPQEAMFFFTDDSSEKLIIRKKEIADNVIPGSNSQMAKNLFLLGHYLYKEDYITRSRNMLKVLQEKIMTNGEFYANWMQLYLWQARGIKEVAIVGPESMDKKRELTSNYLPNCIFIGDTDGNSDLELLDGKYNSDITRIFVCENKTCRRPETEVTAALEQIIP